MKIERCIPIFERHADPLCAERAISDSDFERLKEFITPMDDDPNYWRPYKLDRAAHDVLVTFISDRKKYSYEHYEFYSEGVTV